MNKLFIGLLKETRNNVFQAIGLGLMLSLAAGVSNAWAQPTLTKSFNPAVIGTGTISTLTFTITKVDQDNPLTELAFTDDLPVDVIIATPSNASTTCDFDVGGGVVEGTAARPSLLRKAASSAVAGPASSPST